MRRFLLLLIALFIIFTGYNVIQNSRNNISPVSGDKNQNIPKIPTFNKKLYSTNSPSSTWVVVNKKRPLNPITYAPSDLISPSIALRLSPKSPEMMVRKSTATALEKMFAAAKKDKITIVLASGYRSYTTQQAVYSSEINSYGAAQANLESARAGYSEHQTGFAVDLMTNRNSCEIIACFANTPEGKWLADNAYKYGFILRYPQGKTSITGYNFEPWHFRYVGTGLSNEMRKQKITTLEEFFSLPKAPAY